MENHPHSIWSAAYEKDDFLFELTAGSFSPYDGYLEAIPFSKNYHPHETLPTKPSPETLPVEPSSLSIQEHGFCKDVPSAWSEGDHSAKVLSSSCNAMEGAIEGMKDSKEKKPRKKRNGSAGKLSKEEIAEYFYLPIIQAAKELDVSLTNLKIRCRKLGIQRWPRRKLESLQNLIKDVQEQGEEVTKEDKIRTAVEGLEEEKRMVEERPDRELDDDTLKLRRACSKAKYRKRKLAAMQEVQEATSEAEPKDWETAELLMNFSSILA